jgi:Ca-activated chloride channel family protein
MRQFFLLPIVVGSFLAHTAALQTSPNREAQPQEPVFRAAARTVAVYATVTDENARLIPDLTRDDFEIYDNGRPQAITLFESGVQPITVVLMLDRSGSMVGNFKLVRAAAEQFVSQLGPGDKARIGSFANRVQVDPREFTSSKRDLIAILRTELQEPGPTPLWNAVNVAITALKHQDGRRVVLVFTDGVDRPFGGNNISLSEVMKHAEQEDVMVFAIGLESRYPGGGRGRRAGGFGTGTGIFQPPPDVQKPDPGLRRIAAQTGGSYFELTSANNLFATFTRIADELHRQYALAFTPAKWDGKTHRIEVRLRRPDLTVRGRKTYFAKKDS